MRMLCKPRSVPRIRSFNAAVGLWVEGPIGDALELGGQYAELLRRASLISMCLAAAAVQITAMSNVSAWPVSAA